MEHKQADRSRVDGRTRLLDTAEELLDRHGIDGVSVRTVTKASGHRNSSAVNYHFGTREQLIEAVLLRRQSVVEAQRMARLDELEAAGALDARSGAEAAVQPMVDMLRCLEGRRYLRLLHQAANHPHFVRYTVTDYAPSIVRAGRVALPLVEHLPAERRNHRLRLGIGMVLNAVAQQARLIDADPPSRELLDLETFSADLVDALIGALRA